MDPVTLTLGGRTVTLQRSTRLIGVRPKPGREAGASRAVAAITGAAADPPALGADLGGFRLVEVGALPPAKLDAQLDMLRAEPDLQVGTHVFHLGAGNTVPFVPTGEILVSFRPGTPVQERQSILDRHGLRVLEGRGENDVLAHTTPRSSNPVTTAARLQAEPSVSLAEPDLATLPERRDLDIPDDALFAEQWHLRNTGRYHGTQLGGTPGADARVVDAWQAAGSFGAAEVVLAVIDDGFDLGHPDLLPTERHVAPWDFTRGTDQPVPGNGDWHGTACAGVAIGRRGGGRIIGAAPDVRLMPVRWGPSLSDREVETWFDHATDNGAWVVSCSWGAKSPYFPLKRRIHDAIARCARDGREGRGCVVVFAAGNSNHDIDDPAGGTLDGFAIHPDVIAVAASDSRDQRAEYSNFGNAIWLCAPSSSAVGWGVLTADVRGARGYTPTDHTWQFGGTSSACPLVAGTAALMLSVNPELTAAEVRQIMAATARRIGPDDAWVGARSRLFGHGCVDAAAAVVAAGDRAAAPSPLMVAGLVASGS
jgi:subtilisin family serine protease